MSVQTAERRLLAHRGRVKQIVDIASKYGYAEWAAASAPGSLANLAIRGVDDEIAVLSSGQRLRQALTELGTTFIKIGQILSTRADIVGPDVADELATLQSSVPADPPDEIVAQIEGEFGRDIEEVFARFDEQPLASASIAQVHPAQLADGTEVVVKVQHPGIDEVVRADMEILEALAEIAELRSADLALYRPRATVAELRRSLLAELDLGREARTLMRFRENFANEPDLVVPEPFTAASTGRVLTMTRLDGEGFATIVDQLDHEVGKRLVRRGAEIYIEMIFRDGLFHADPHPGNIMLLDDGRIGLLDFGKVGRIDDELQDSLDDLVLAIMAEDLEATVDAILDLCDPPTDLDRSRLKEDVADWLDANVAGAIGDVAVAAASEGAMEIIHVHRLKMPGDVALLIRVLVQLQGLLVATGEEVTLSEVLAPSQNKIALQRYSPQRFVKKLRRTAHDWERLIETAPRDLTAILDAMARGDVDIPMRLENLDRNVNRLSASILGASLFLGATRLWASKVPPLVRGMSAPGAIATLGSAIIAARTLKATRSSGGL